MEKCPNCGRNYFSKKQFKKFKYDEKELLVCPNCVKDKEKEIHSKKKNSITYEEALRCNLIASGIKEDIFIRLTNNLNDDEKILGITTLSADGKFGYTILTDKRIIIQEKSGVIREVLDYLNINRNSIIRADANNLFGISFEFNNRKFRLSDIAHTFIVKKLNLDKIIKTNIDLIIESKKHKKCKKCQFDNKIENIICSYCGEKFGEETLKIPCPQCDTINDFNDKFCCECGAVLNIGICPECGNKIKEGKNFCSKCGYSLMERIAEYKTFKELEVEQSTGEIKCPFCSKMFKPSISSPTSTSGNIARGIVFLPWGVISAVKNKKFIQCPHCKMKIMQG